MNPHTLFKTVLKYAVVLSFINTCHSVSIETLSKRDNTSVLPEECQKTTTEIENSFQLHRLQLNCPILKGDLVLQNFQDPIVDLGNIKEIHGSFTIENSSNVVRLETPNLLRITDMFKLKTLTSLNSIYMNKISEIGSIYWRIVPNLSIVQFKEDFSKINNIIISDTSLTSLDNFNNIKHLSVFNLNNNRFLEYINAKNMKSVSQGLVITSNSQTLQVNLESLVWANNITIRDCSMTDLGKLQYVNESMEFIDNYFTELELPALEKIGGSLGIIENKNVNTVDLNNITDIVGGVVFLNNTALTAIDFFSNLKQIGGAINFQGTFNKVEFPALKLVKGSVSISSNSHDLDCSQWTNPPDGVSIIRGGKITCSSSKKKTNISLSETGEILNSDEVEVHDTHSKNKTHNKSSSIKSENTACVNSPSLQKIMLMVCATLMVTAFLTTV